MPHAIALAWEHLRARPPNRGRSGQRSKDPRRKRRGF